MTKISSLSINGRITLNMHSLNNEGGEGNQTITRQVTIFDSEGNPATVTAVSGDMLKHIQAEHLFNIAKEENISLCGGCKTFNANRITVDDDFVKFLKDKPNDEKKLDEVIKRCVIDEIEGILVTNEKNNLPRKSVAEFGWLVALPDKNESENYFHVKFVNDSGETETDSSNQGQNIFHRPANSGIYAFVGNFEISRIGYNDISKKYSIEDDERKKRFKALLKSILYTFIKPAGAMRNTQNPHVVNFEGVISFSENSCPAPTISAINPNFKSQIKDVCSSLNNLGENALKTLEFSNISEFTEKFSSLINESEPKRISNGE